MEQINPDLGVHAQENRSYIESLEDALIDYSKVVNSADDSYIMSREYFLKHNSQIADDVFKGFWMGWPAEVRNVNDKYRELLNKVLDTRVRQVRELEPKYPASS